MPVAGNVVRASDRNTQYLAVLRAAAVQSIPDNSATPLAFDTDDIDDDSGHSPSSSNTKYFAQRQGRFEISATGAHGASTAGTSRNLGLNVNGVAVTVASVSSGPRPGGTGTFTQNMSGQIVTLIVGDYIEIVMTQNTGGALNTAANSTVTIRYWGDD